MIQLPTNTSEAEPIPSCKLLLLAIDVLEEHELDLTGKELTEAITNKISEILNTRFPNLKKGDTIFYSIDTVRVPVIIDSITTDDKSGKVTIRGIYKGQRSSEPVNIDLRYISLR